MGITPDASHFLQQLCSQNSSVREDIFSTNALLAGRCLTARPIVRETGLEAQIIERLFELLMSTQYSLLRQEAIKVVCSIGVFETNRRLVTLLSDERLHVSVRWNIAGALAVYNNDISIVEGLVKPLQDKEISDSVYNALWTISRRAGVWIFPMHLIAHTRNVKQSQAQYEIVPWE